MPLKFDLRSLAVNWQSSIVWREDVGKFSGGVLNPKTMANLDSCGKGPSGRFRVGRKIVYPVDSLVKWIEDKAKIVE